MLGHGAFASPAGWSGVADGLHKDGYRTATPTLGLASVAQDVAIVRSTLDSIPGDKTVITGQQKYYQVWVGHRFGYVKAEDVQVLAGR